jgi:hypothetical protein
MFKKFSNYSLIYLYLFVISVFFSFKNVNAIDNKIYYAPQPAPDFAYNQYQMQYPGNYYNNASYPIDNFFQYNSRTPGIANFFALGNGLYTYSTMGIGYTFGVLNNIKKGSIDYSEIFPSMMHGFSVRTGLSVNDRYIAEIVISNMYGKQDSGYAGTVNMTFLTGGIDMGMKFGTGLLQNRLDVIILGTVGILAKNVQHENTQNPLKQGGYFFTYGFGGGLEFNFNNFSALRFDLRNVFVTGDPTMNSFFNGNLTLVFKV